MTINNLGRKELIGLYVLITIPHWESETWRQELKHRTWRKVLTGLFTIACSVKSFMSSRTTYLGGVPPTVVDQ